eukprot:3563787-Prorocentrum_lima.AAC.1
MSTACLLYHILCVRCVSPQASALPLPRTAQAIILCEATVTVSLCSEPRRIDSSKSRPPVLLAV